MQLGTRIRQHSRPHYYQKTASYSSAGSADIRPKFEKECQPEKQRVQALNKEPLHCQSRCTENMQQLPLSGNLDRAVAVPLIQRQNQNTEQLLQEEDEAQLADYYHPQ